MSISVNKPLAKSLNFDDGMMWIELTDGRQLGVPLAYFPRLVNSSQKNLESYIISGGGRGLHWESLDEDISVEHLLMGFGDITARTHPTHHEAQPLVT